MDNNNGVAEENKSGSKLTSILCISFLVFLAGLVIYSCTLSPEVETNTEEVEYEEPKADIVWSEVNVEKYDFNSIKCNFESVNTFYDSFFSESDDEIFIDNVRVSGTVIDIKTDATFHDGQTEYTVLTVSDDGNSEHTLDIYFKDIENCANLLTSGDITVGKEIVCYVAIKFPKDEDLQDPYYYAQPEDDMYIYYESAHDVISGSPSQVIRYCNNLKNASFVLEGAVYKINGMYRLYADYENAPNYFVMLEDYDGPLATDVTVQGNFKGTMSVWVEGYSSKDRAILGNVKIMESN